MASLMSLHESFPTPPSSRIGLPAVASPAAPILPTAPTPPRTQLQALPPHQRAQVLLQEMAGLTARFFELAGSKTWQGTHHKNIVSNILPGATLPAEGAAATFSKEVLSMIESHQLLLLEAVSEIAELEELEQEKKRIADTINAKDIAMRQFAKRVRDAAQVLEFTVEEFEEYRRPKQPEKENGHCKDSEDFAIGQGSVDIQDLVAYAHRISYTTFAPPEYATGQPLRGAFPPAPQDEHLRASQLYVFKDLDVGIPKTAMPLSSPGVSPMDIEVVKAEALSQPLTLPTTLPPGWKPGMPVELPTDLLPPPGWKPGDPISFDLPIVPPGWKPGDAIVLPSSLPARAAEPPKTATPAPSAPAPVFVPYVNLDLDANDDESEYSDEGASSDDEE